MFTIFAIPKPFHGHIGVIQRNAITSWTLLRPHPEIILFGNEEGTEELSHELNLKHIPGIARNPFGTPLLNDLFEQAEKNSTRGLMCYVNADILLLSEFQSELQKIAAKFKTFLAVSKRINLEIREPIVFESDWQSEIKRVAAQIGSPGDHTSIDVFAFPRNTYPEIPDFGIGRLWFDQWLIKSARQRRVPVIDLSLIAPVLHQNHDYNHVRGGADWVWQGEEAAHNLRLYGGIEHAYTLLDVTHELSADDKLRRTPFRRLKFNIWKSLIYDTAPVRHRLGLRRHAIG